MTPKAPKGWTVRGDLPKVDLGTANDAELDLLDEDLVQVVEPGGQYTLDVGWYPAGSREGRYICRLVRAEEWESPLEQLETNSREAVRQWLVRGVEDIQRRLGSPGQFVTRIGVFISARRAGRGRRAAKEQINPLLISPRISSPTHTQVPSSMASSPSSTARVNMQPALQHAT